MYRPCGYFVLSLGNVSVVLAVAVEELYCELLFLKEFREDLYLKRLIDLVIGVRGIVELLAYYVFEVREVYLNVGRFLLDVLAFEVFLSHLEMHLIVELIDFGQ